MHLREEVTRTASLEVSKAWEKEEEEADQGDQGEKNKTQFCTQLRSREKERWKERVHKSAKNTQNFPNRKTRS